MIHKRLDSFRYSSAKRAEKNVVQDVSSLAHVKRSEGSNRCSKLSSTVVVLHNENNCCRGGHSWHRTVPFESSSHLAQINAAKRNTPERQMHTITYDQELKPNRVYFYLQNNTGQTKPILAASAIFFPPQKISITHRIDGLIDPTGPGL